MQCCVAKCETFSTSENSERKGITFHSFPTDTYLRAAWLRALGTHYTPQSDPAVVCSLHFLDDDFYETVGVRQIRSDAVPSTVQMCMICLDTDSKLILMSKHNLEELYILLTGQNILCPRTNLQQTLCVLCAQRLIHFKRFRNMSLRARELMIDLFEKYELITKQHINMIKQELKQFKCNFVSTSLADNHCDLDVYNSDKDQHQTLDKCVVGDAATFIKDENSHNCSAIADNMEAIHKDDSEAEDFDENMLSNEELLEYHNNKKSKESTAYIYHSDKDQHQTDKCVVGDAATFVKDEDCRNCSAIADNMEATNEDDNDDEDLNDVMLSKEELLEYPNNKMSKESSVLFIDIEDALQKTAGVSCRVPEEVAETQNSVKLESASLTCTLCSVAFEQENVYYEHMSTHLEDVDYDTGCDQLQVCEARAAIGRGLLHRGNKQAVQRQNADSLSADSAQAVVDPLTDVDTEEAKNLSSQSDTKAYTDINKFTNCVVRLYKKPKKAVLDEKPNMKTCTVAPLTDVDTEEAENLTSQSDTKVYTDVNKFTNCIDRLYDNSKKPKKAVLDENRIMKTCTGEKYFTCDICNYKCAFKGRLTQHMRIHTGVKPFSCEICDYKCLRKNDLVSHLRTHTGKTHWRYSCEICNYRFPYKRRLFQHMKTHNRRKLNACDICKQQFARKCALIKHKMIHTGEKPYSCEICIYKCNRKYNLDLHMRIHTGHKPYSCELCDFKSARKDTLLRHLTEHTGEKLYSCNICRYKCNSKKSLSDHTRIHLGEKPYSCDLCEYKSTTKRSLIYHLEIHTGLKPYRCDTCNYQCANKRSLVYHLRTHTRLKPYLCDKCDYQSATKGSLVLHLRTHANEKPYLCDKCNYQSTTKGSLVLHLRTHTGEKPFTCDMCNYSCTTKGNLVRHIKLSHSNNKSKSCEICNYKFTHAYLLARHLKSHTGEKCYSWSCDICNKKYAQKSHLLTHMKIHTGRVPFSCDICGYTCAYNSLLIIHMRTHTGEKPYTCEICNRKFAQKSQMIKHMKIH